MSPNGQTEQQTAQPRTQDELQNEAELMKQVEATAPRARTSNADLLALIVENDQKANYAQQIVEAELVRDAFDQDWRLAKVFAMSGVFSDIKGSTHTQAIATAMAKIQLGRSWGMSPADSMQMIYFTNGRPAIMVEILGVKMRDAGFDWDPEFYYEKPGDDNSRCIGCRLWLKKFNAKTGAHEAVKDRNGNDVSAKFTKADGDTAMIWEKGKQIRLSEKWNFQSWPEDMYFSRALGRLRKRYASNVLKGAITQPEAEELAPTESATSGLSAAAELLKEKLAANRAPQHPQVIPQADKPGEPAQTQSGEPQASQEGTVAPTGEQKSDDPQKFTDGSDKPPTMEQLRQQMEIAKSKPRR